MAWLDIAATLILLAALTAISWIDLRERRIPDRISLPLIASGLAYWALYDGGALVWALAGAAAGYALIALLAWAYRRYRGREGIGLGDAKLLAAGGAWLGLPTLPYVLLIASASGLVWALLTERHKKLMRENAIPFGPFLALGIIAMWLIMLWSR